MKHASAMDALQRFGDLDRQRDGILRRLRSLERLPVDIFQHEVIGADVMDLADVRMIQSSDGASFVFERDAGSFLQPLHCDETFQPSIDGFPHLSHTTRTYWRK